MRSITAKIICMLTISSLLLGTAYAQGKRILVFGDSNTWGWQAVAQGFPSTRFADQNRWTGVLQKRLGARYRIIVDGLNGRTLDVSYPGKVASLPGAQFSGETTLSLALAREAPLDLVIIALGTNDLQDDLKRTPDQIAQSAGKLVQVVLRDYAGVFTAYAKPKVLVVTPPPLCDTSKTPFKDMFGPEAKAKSVLLAATFAQVARQDGFAVFDAGRTVRTCSIDGIHLPKQEHARLGTSLAPEVLRLLGR